AEDQVRLSPAAEDRKGVGRDPHDHLHAPWQAQPEAEGGGVRRRGPERVLLEVGGGHRGDAARPPCEVRDEDRQVRGTKGAEKPLEETAPGPRRPGDGHRRVGHGPSLAHATTATLTPRPAAGQGFDLPLAGSAVLASWNDIAPGGDAEFDHWHTTEHIPERVSVPGFLRGRRYNAIAGNPTYFTLYETDTVAVLQSPAYLARLNAPTPWTAKCIQLFRN